MSRSLRVLAFRQLNVDVAQLLGATMAVLLLFGGCSGGSNVASRLDTQQVGPMDEVAVVSIRTEKLYDNEIDAAPSGDTTGVREAVHAITEMSERQDRRAEPSFRLAAEQLREYLFGPFRSAAPFSLVKETPILTSPTYRNFEPPRGLKSGWQSSLFTTPSDYRPLGPSQLQKSGRLPAFIETLPGPPDGLLFAETTFTLITDGVQRAPRKKWTSPTETGTQGRPPLSDGDTVRVDVVATVRVLVLDPRGGTALKVVQTGRSTDGFSFVYGEGWTASQINAPTRRATRAALENTTTHLRNKLPSGAVAQVSGALR